MYVQKLWVSRRRGFTLIEVLVVIVIIGVLAGLGLQAFTKARASAKDTKRKADLETIRSALELYRSDNKWYGLVNSGWCTTLYGCGQTQWYDDVAGELVTGGYLSALPQDPLYKNQSGKDYFFKCTDGGARCTKYELYAQMEVSANSNGSYNMGNCGCAGIYNYKVASP